MLIEARERKWLIILKMAASYGCMLGKFMEAAIDFGWVCDALYKIACVTYTRYLNDLRSSRRFAF